MTDLTKVLVIREYLKEQLQANATELNGYSDGFSYAVMVEGNKTTLNWFTNEHLAVEMAQTHWESAHIYTNNPEFIEADIEGSIYYTEHMDDLTVNDTPDDCIRVYDGSARHDVPDDFSQFTTDQPAGGMFMSEDGKELSEGDNTEDEDDQEKGDYYKKQEEAHDLEEEIAMLTLFINQRSNDTPAALILNRTRKRLNNILRTIVVFIVICVMMGCESESGKRAEREYYASLDSSTHRIKVLENGTISYVRLSPDERQVFGYRDTVWVDLASHTISDTASGGMKCAILMNLNKIAP